MCAQHPKPFFRCSTPQNSANDGAQKCSPRTTRFCSGTHRVYPALCFDFVNHPFLFILHPILFIPHPILFNFARPSETRKQTSPLNPARKIPHTTGKLPTVTTVMQPQQHSYLPGPQRFAVTDEQLATPMKPHCEAWWHGRR